MPKLVFTKDIHCPIEAVFNLIADLPNYGKWLSAVDKGQFSTLTGTVTEFDPPRRITFSQGMPFRSAIIRGQVTNDIHYSLEPRNGGTHVTRTVKLKLSGLVYLGQPVLVRQIAGILARRIVCYVHMGDAVRAGDELGFIKFGSRCDVFLPPDAQVLVKMQDKIVGGETILARL